MCDGHLKTFLLFPSVLEKNYSLTKWWWLCQKEWQEGEEREKEQRHIRSTEAAAAAAAGRNFKTNIYQVSPGLLLSTLWSFDPQQPRQKTVVSFYRKPTIVFQGNSAPPTNQTLLAGECWGQNWVTEEVTGPDPPFSPPQA